MPRTPQMMLAGRAAQFLGIHRDTLRRWNRDGVGPPRELKGKRYWYCLEALREWLKSGGRALVAEHAAGLPGARAQSPSAASASLRSDPLRRFR